VWESDWDLALDQNTSQDVSARATDPNGTALTFSRQGGTAPVATTVSSAGIVAVAASAGGSYLLGIRASNGSLATDISVTLTVSVVITAPNPPTGFAANAVGANEIDLQWVAPTAGPPPTAYDLNRSLTGSGGWSGNLSSGTGVTFDNTGLTASTQYFYRLRSENAGLFSSYVTANAITEAVTSSSADFIISAGTASWSGATLRVPLTGGSARAVQAGDIIELAAGTYPRLTLSNIAPSAASVTDPNTDYVTIRGPATGKATITASSGTSNILILDTLRFVKIDAESLTTAPDADGKRRNIVVSATGTATPTFIVKFTGSGTGYNQTRDIVIRYLEIKGNWSGTGANGARIGLGTNGAYKDSDYPTSWQENMILEHLYIHDNNTEGIYIGSNPSNALTAGGRDVAPRYIKIRYCLFEHCGGSGVNNKSWFGGTAGPDQFPTTFDRDTNNSIHDCDFFRCGLDNSATANPPLSPAISAQSCKAAVYNNRFEASGGLAISFRVQEGTEVNYPTGISKVSTGYFYNNIIKGSASKGGLQITTSATMANPSYFPLGLIYSNTVISNTGEGIKFDANVNSGSFARNNIVIGNSTQITWGSVTNENSKNLVTGSVSTAIFQDVTGTIEAGTVDFHLSNPQSRAAGSVLGTDLSSTDLDGDTRVLANADMGAYEYP
jgi:hypothetical protein